MEIRAGDTVLPAGVFDQPGRQTLTRSIPPFADPPVLSFQLDRALAPDSQDPRERGIIVADFASDQINP
jgi:hypothetical protein